MQHESTKICIVRHLFGSVSDRSPLGTDTNQNLNKNTIMQGPWELVSTPIIDIQIAVEWSLLWKEAVIKVGGPRW